MFGKKKIARIGAKIINEARITKEQLNAEANASNNSPDKKGSPISSRTPRIAEQKGGIVVINDLTSLTGQVFFQKGSVYVEHKNKEYDIPVLTQDEADLLKPNSGNHLG